jgi:hypothetical protein
MEIYSLGRKKRGKCLSKHIVMLQVDTKDKIARRRCNIDNHSQKVKGRLEYPVTDSDLKLHFSALKEPVCQSFQYALLTRIFQNEFKHLPLRSLKCIQISLYTHTHTHTQLI